MKLFETNFSKEKPELIAAPVLLSTFKFQLTGLKGIESFISEPASEYNLSFEQFLILRKIINHPNIKLMDIAEQRQVTRSAVSRQLKVLFQQKYVEQKADPADRRRMFLVATKKGKDAESEIWQRINHRFANWVQIYGEDRADQFLTLFEDFNQQIIQGNIRKKE